MTSTRFQIFFSDILDMFLKAPKLSIIIVPILEFQNLLDQIMVPRKGKQSSKATQSPPPQTLLDPAILQLLLSLYYAVRASQFSVKDWRQ